MKRAACVALVALAASAALTLPAWAAPLPARLLPQHLAPEAPFPSILSQAPTIEPIAPGIAYGQYDMLTAAGPLVVRVVAADMHDPYVRVGTVLADGSLVSHGETVGAMAQRTHAVAGINGDYFAIGSTDEPTNIVVRDGALLRMPRKRYAVAIGTDGSVTFGEFSFVGQVQLQDRALPLAGIDELPPPGGGTALVTPQFGTIPPLANVTLIALQLLDGTPPLARYRVASIVDNDAPQPAGYYLAIGPSAYGIAALPSPGDVISASGDLQPVPLDRISAAIGGGPLILNDGAWVDDPDGPKGGEFSRAIPCSGVATTPDGELLLIEVDGRQPLESVGITRPQLSALMRALGATEGMALDGGGSSTIVARRLGDVAATLQNAPSDGRERPVGDALLVYSTAPAGPAVRLVAQPGVVRAVAGAQIPLRIAAVDAANHVVPPSATIQSRVVPAMLGRLHDGLFTATGEGEGAIVMRAGTLHGRIPIEVTRTPARIAIAPAHPNVARFGTLALRARAFDAHGYALALPDLLPWRTRGGSIDPHGIFRAETQNARVSVAIGDVVASGTISVGTHAVALAFAQHARFVTAPHGGSGSVERDATCGTCTTLRYAFGSDERAAYAVVNLALPPATVGLAFDVNDGGDGARLKIAVRNAIAEDLFVSATVLDRPGWRHVTVRFPPQASRPVMLVGIYVLPARGTQVAAGSVEIRNVRAVVAGGEPPAPAPQ